MRWWKDKKISRGEIHRRFFLFQMILHNLEINFSCLLSVIIRNVSGNWWCIKKYFEWWKVKFFGRKKSVSKKINLFTLVERLYRIESHFLWHISIPKWFIYKPEKNKFSTLITCRDFFLLFDLRRHNAETTTLIIHALPFLYSCLALLLNTCMAKKNIFVNIFTLTFHISFFCIFFWLRLGFILHNVETKKSSLRIIMKNFLFILRIKNFFFIKKFFHRTL